MGKFTESIIDKNTKAKASRLAFGEAIAEFGAQNEKIVTLDADLSKSTMTMHFAQKFPQRFFNMGIAEANMIGVAAGLSNAGKIPFAASFGCFLTGRYDQIRMSVAFSGSNVRLIGTHAGVGIGEDGHSQMALEDLALMRSLPNMTVFQPADEWETKEFIRWSLEHQGPCYMRLTRQNLPALNRKNKKFAVGQWDLLTDLSADGGIVIIGSGSLLAVGITAADQLVNHQKSAVDVINANWIQPYDEKLLEKVLQRKPRLIVTLEDHYRTGGLGSVVAEFLSSHSQHAPLLRIGVEGFGQSGSPADNYKHYGFTPEAIVAKILRAIG